MRRRSRGEPEASRTGEQNYINGPSPGRALKLQTSYLRRGWRIKAREVRQSGVRVRLYGQTNFVERGLGQIMQQDDAFSIILMVGAGPEMVRGEGFAQRLKPERVAAGLLRPDPEPVQDRVKGRNIGPGRGIFRRKGTARQPCGHDVHMGEQPWQALKTGNQMPGINGLEAVGEQFIEAPARFAAAARGAKTGVVTENPDRRGRPQSSARSSSSWR